MSEERDQNLPPVQKSETALELVVVGLLAVLVMVLAIPLFSPDAVHTQAQTASSTR